MNPAGIAVIEAAMRATLAATVDSSVWAGPRWPNEPWASTVSLSQGNAPVTPDGRPMPYIEAELIVGEDIAYVAPEGNRLALRLGLMRIYLATGQQTGSTVMTTQVDAIWPAFKRKTLLLDQLQWQRLTTMDPRIDDNVATTETGDRFVRQISVPWEFWYRN